MGCSKSTTVQPAVRVSRLEVSTFNYAMVARPKATSTTSIEEWGNKERQAAQATRNTTFVFPVVLDQP